MQILLPVSFLISSLVRPVSQSFAQHQDPFQPEAQSVSQRKTTINCSKGLSIENHHTEGYSRKQDEGFYSNFELTDIFSTQHNGKVLL